MDLASSVAVICTLTTFAVKRVCVISCESETALPHDALNSHFTARLRQNNSKTENRTP